MLFIEEEPVEGGVAACIDKDECGEEYVFGSDEAEILCGADMVELTSSFGNRDGFGDVIDCNRDNDCYGNEHVSKCAELTVNGERPIGTNMFCVDP